LRVEVSISGKNLDKAFRKMKRKCHPEVNPGDDGSRELYEEICRAYRVLGDGRLRAEYDSLGHEEFFRRSSLVQEKTAGEGETLPEGIAGEGIIGDIFGLKDRTPGTGASPGKDVRHVVPLSLLQAVRGGEVEITFNRRTACPECRGSGAARESGRQDCPDCASTGFTTVEKGPLSTRVECRGCRGRGYVIEKACAVCREAGLVERLEKVTVEIPPGVSSGSETRGIGLGHQDPSGGPPGDLLVITRVEEDPGIERKGDNLFSRVPLMVWEAALGAKILVATVEGKVPLVIPPGTQWGQRFKLGGKGVPNLKTGRRGDQFVTVEVVIPPPGDEESLKAYERLAELFTLNPRVR
jgi:molecular chaperone DnaJ